MAGALNILSGIAAAAAGFSGEKVSKDGSVPGLDLTAIVPTMLGSKSGGVAGILSGALASMSTGLFGNSKLGNIGELAGSLFSTKKTTAAATATNTSNGVAGLAAAIIGNSGAGSLGSIATMATNLAKTAKSTKEVNNIASDLGKTLSSSFGVSFDGGGSALRALDKVMGNDKKGELFKAILGGLT